MDFVILWVNDKDPEWRAAYEKYALIETGEKRECRFRDWENLHYWFRGVEKFAPWVDKVFLIVASPSQLPKWLNTNHPKLRIVYHDEYIPKELLPTFNSNTIELFLHKIPDLSEQFVLFNDDFFLINKVKPERFFIKGLPVDICAMNVYYGDGTSATSMNNLEIINKHFKKQQVLRKNFSKWFNLRNGDRILRTFLLIWWPKFVGFYEPHLPQPLLKSTFQEVWEKEYNTIMHSFHSHFRQKSNLTWYLFRYWQLTKGYFVPYNVRSDGMVFYLTSFDSVKAATKTIRNQEKKMITINDSESISYERSKLEINQAFETILSKKSSFEK